MSGLHKWGESEKAVARRAAAGQTVLLTCGVDGCRKTWTGLWGELLEHRDEHRAQRHPGYVRPKRPRQKAVQTRRYDGGWEETA